MTEPADAPEGGGQLAATATGEPDDVLDTFKTGADGADNDNCARRNWRTAASQLEPRDRRGRACPDREHGRALELPLRPGWRPGAARRPDTPPAEPARPTTSAVTAVREPVRSAIAARPPIRSRSCHPPVGRCSARAHRPPPPPPAVRRPIAAVARSPSSRSRSRRPSRASRDRCAAARPTPAPRRAPAPEAPVAPGPVTPREPASGPYVTARRSVFDDSAAGPRHDAAAVGQGALGADRPTPAGCRSAGAALCGSRRCRRQRPARCCRRCRPPTRHVSPMYTPPIESAPSTPDINAFRSAQLRASRQQRQRQDVQPHDARPVPDRRPRRGGARVRPPSTCSRPSGTDR